MTHKVLLVASDRHEAAMLGTMIRRGDQSIMVVVVSAHEAREVLSRRSSPQVILLDLDADADETEARCQLAREMAGAIPVVALTTLDESALTNQLLNAEVQDVLVKWRFTASELQRVLRYAVERHRALAALRRARAEAEAASVAKSQFVANMSHEIRTPLTAMLGLAELLEESPLSDEQRRQVLLLRRAGEHLHVLVDDVLEMGRIDAGTLEIEAVRFDLRELATGVVELMMERARARGLELTCKLGADVGPTCGDPHRLRQVLLNLIGNAIKFTEAGQVVLSMTRIDADAVAFTVRDTGIGIAADRLGAVFDRFVQAEADTARRHGGTGLGLSISQGLVALMGGALAVKSRLGQGSVFSFDLPLPARVELARGALETPELEQHAHLRVLIIEDTPALGELVMTLLGRAGHTSEVVADARSALARVEAQPAFDAVLLDLHLPEHDGFMTFELLQGHWRGRGSTPPPIVAMTADVVAETRQRCLDAGFAGFLPKPLQRHELLATLTRCASAKVGSFSSEGQAPADVKLAADLERIKRRFVTRCSEDVGNVRAALDRGSIVEAEDFGHRLRGTAASFGLALLARAGTELEQAARALDRNGLVTAVDAVAAALSELHATEATS